MAISMIDNIGYKGKKPDNVRSQFSTLAEMKAYSENYLPDMYDSFCLETRKKYRYDVNNDVDTTTGKWRELEVPQEQTFKDSLIATNQPYLYKGESHEIPDWDKINTFIEDKSLNGSCSGFVRDGKFYRSFDFLYNDTVSFVVDNRVSGYKGMAGAIPELTKSVVDSRVDVDWYDYIPFILLDGINSYGISVSAYILHREGERTDQGDTKQRICSSVLTSYLLCNLTDVDDLSTVLGDICVYMPSKPTQFATEYHWLISDGTKTVCLEYVNNLPVITNITTNPYITNFYLKDWDGSDLSTTNAHAQGIERWNLIKEGADLEDIAYTHTYSLVGTENVWRSEFNDVWSGGRDITTSTPNDDPDLIAVETASKTAWENRTRGNGTWHTQHACIYDFETKSFKVCTQEDYETWYSETEGYTKSEIDNLLSQKMDKSNPSGTGSFSLNRKSGTEVGNYSFAEGHNTSATGESSHAEGEDTEAEGVCSHAEGYGSMVITDDTVEHSGDYAHAEGMRTTALGSGSHSEGLYTHTNNPGEHAEGRGNISNKNSDTFGDARNTIHSVGIGGTEVGTFKNAHEIMQNGDHYVFGIGGYDGTNPSTAKTLQEVINAKKVAFFNIPDEEDWEDETVIRPFYNTLKTAIDDGEFVIVTEKLSGDFDSWVYYTVAYNSVDSSEEDQEWINLTSFDGIYVDVLEIHPVNISKTETEMKGEVIVELDKTDIRSVYEELFDISEETTPVLHEKVGRADYYWKFINDEEDENIGSVTGYIFLCSKNGELHKLVVSNNFYQETILSNQASTMPTANAYNLGQIIQYTGTTTSDYTNGFFYKCTESSGAYSWETVNVQSGGGTSSCDVIPMYEETCMDIVDAIEADPDTYKQGSIIQVLSELPISGFKTSHFKNRYGLESFPTDSMFLITNDVDEEELALIYIPNPYIPPKDFRIVDFPNVEETTSVTSFCNDVYAVLFENAVPFVMQSIVHSSGAWLDYHFLSYDGCILEGTQVRGYKFSFCDAENNKIYLHKFYKNGTYEKQEISLGGGGSAELERAITPNITVGNLKSGETIAQGTSLTELFEKMLIQYQKPVVSVSITPSTLVYKEGTSVDITDLSCSVTKKSEDIANVKFYQNGTLLETITDGVASGGNFTYSGTIDTITDVDTTFKATATDVTTGSTVESSKTIKFVVPFYYGVLDSNEMSSSVLDDLTSDISEKENKTYTYTSDSQYLVIVYPSEYGELVSIKDSNNFENISVFNTNTMDSKYRYYISKESKTVNNFTLTFKFN